MQTGNSGRPRRLNANQEQEIVDSVRENPGTSVRCIARQTGNHKSTVHRVLKEHNLYPYHLQKVQTLLPQDFEKRVSFCNWLCQQNTRNVLFPSCILFSDEATFTRNGVTNLHNTHLWANENPRAVIQTHHQVHFKVNVWAGIVDDYLLGPVFLPPIMNGGSFLSFLRNMLPDLLDDLPLVIRRNIWFQMDGAPPHFARTVTDYINEVFPNRWIGRGHNAPVLWPPRSPDLNPLDFALWGVMKDFVYMVPIENEQHLRERIVEAGEQFRLKPNIFRNIRVSLIKRARTCINLEGRHFENVI